MKTIRRFTLGSLVLALLASCLGAGMARAQEMQGKFTLPFDARWGQATLPAGDYSFTVDQSKSAARLVLSGENTRAIIRAQGYDPKSSDSSSLVLATDRGISTVRELKLADLGVVLYFTPSRPHQTAAQEKEMANVIPITPNSGK
ncbi:MAG TPA: hypothetical protein VGZ29_08965 [Terriglobia bacterium]|nr:hypothetical protein [Terriglobia bacterium]